MTGIRDRSGVKSLTDTNLPSGTGAIAAAKHREVVKSVSDSAVLFGEAEVRVINMTTTSPPGSPSDRDAYVVASGATGDWSGQDDNIAIWDASISPAAWVFVAPVDGSAVWNLDDDSVWRWDAGVSPAAWVLKSPGTDDDAIHDNVAGEIAAVTEKATPVSADLLLMEDSADSNNKKRIQVGNLPGSGSGGSLLASHDFSASPTNEVIVTGIDLEDAIDIVAINLGSGTATLGLRVQLSTDNGSTVLDGAADYHIGLIALDGSTTLRGDSDNDELGYIGSGGATASSGIYGNATIHSARNTDVPTWAEFRGSHGGGVSWRHGVALTVQAHNAVVLSHLDGTDFTSGQVYVVRR